MYCSVTKKDIIWSDSKQVLNQGNSVGSVDHRELTKKPEKIDFKQPDHQNTSNFNQYFLKFVISIFLKL